MPTTPHAIAHHLDAYQSDGFPAHVPNGGFATETWADFSPEYSPNGDTLAAARAHADMLFATIARVAYVDIRESVQDHRGCSWRAGRHVERIERGDRPGPAYTVARCDDDPELWAVTGPHAGGSRFAGREWAERAAARLMNVHA